MNDRNVEALRGVLRLIRETEGAPEDIYIGDFDMAQSLAERGVLVPSSLSTSDLVRIDALAVHGGVLQYDLLPRALDLIAKGERDHISSHECESAFKVVVQNQEAL